MPHAAQPAISEESLLERHRRGDDGAFIELVQHFRGPVHNYLFRCGLDPATREDLMQEIFMKVHAALDRYRPDRPLRAWVFTIAANTARSHFRKLAARGREVGEERAEPVATGPTSQQLLEAREAAEWLGDAVARLPLAQREVIVLCCIENLSHSAVAEVLDIPINTVKTHLHRARLALAKELARRRAASNREVAS